MSAGCAIGYRRNANGGSWIARFRDDSGQRSYEALGSADDATDANGLTVFSFAQAQSRARSYFERRAREIAGDVVTTSGPFTVAHALDAYLTAYKRRGGKSLDLMVGKAQRPAVGAL